MSEDLEVEDTNVMLEPGDSCFIFCKDKSMKLFMSNSEDSAVEYNTPEGNAFLVAMLFSDDPRMEALKREIWDMAHEMATEAEAN